MVEIKQERNPPALHNIFTCIQCGKEAHRRLSGSNKANGLVNKYCSMACRSAYAVDRKSAARQMRAGLAIMRKVAKMLSTFPLHVVEPKQHVCVCIDCSMSYVREPRKSKTTCPPCIAARAEAKLRAARKLYRKTDVAQASKAKSKAIRRAKQSIEAERVSPLKVFARDNWRCQLCGVSTPQSLRGKHKPNSPELDHVIPLALGGEHTWANLQCTCRACNGAKGSRPLGQIGLGFGV